MLSLWSVMQRECFLGYLGTRGYQGWTLDTLPPVTWRSRGSGSPCGPRRPPWAWPAAGACSAAHLSHLESRTILTSLLLEYNVTIEELHLVCLVRASWPSCRTRRWRAPPRAAGGRSARGAAARRGPGRVAASSAPPAAAPRSGGSRGASRPRPPGGCSRSPSSVSAGLLCPRTSQPPSIYLSISSKAEEEAPAPLLCLRHTQLSSRARLQ